MTEHAPPGPEHGSLARGGDAVAGSSSTGATTPSAAVSLLRVQSRDADLEAATGRQEEEEQDDRDQELEPMQQQPRPASLGRASRLSRSATARHLPTLRAASNKAHSASSSEGGSLMTRLLGARSGVLWLFSATQLLIFYDRGMVAGFLPALQADLGALSDTQAGVLGSGFIFGYMLACPLFAFFSKSHSSYGLMALGLGLWVVATFACGVATSFPLLLAGRILTGVGEASFAGLAPTCIDDEAPAAHRTLWLSFFFAAIPLGSAGGYVAGGWFAKQGERARMAGVGDGWWELGWRVGFWSESLIMIPLVAIVLWWPTRAGATGGATAQGTANAVGDATRATVDTRSQHPRLPHTSSWNRAASSGSEAGLALEGESPAPVAVAASYGSMDQASSSRPGRGAMNRSISTPALARLDLVSPSAFSAPPPDSQQEAPTELSFAPHVPHAPLTPATEEETPSPSASPGPSAPVRSGEEPAPMQLEQRATSERTQYEEIKSSTPAAALETASLSHTPTPPPSASSSSSHPSAVPASEAGRSKTRTSRERHSRQTHAVVRIRPDTSASSAAAAADPHRHLLTPSSWNPHYDRRRAAALAALSSSSREMAEGAEGGAELFVSDVVTLLTDGVYLVVVAGYAALAFVIGALSFWGPVDFSKNLGISLSRATRLIGAITFVCGLGGTFFGGWILDRRGGAKGIFAVINALELCCAFTTLSIGFALAAVLSLDLTTSMLALSLADFFLFATGPPVNAALLSVAPRNMRSLAMAMSILLMHALGDLPSPFLMGLITDQVGSVRMALVVLCLWLLWTVAFWGAGVWLARKRANAFRAQLAREMSMDPAERAQLLQHRRRGSTGSVAWAHPPHRQQQAQMQQQQAYPHSAHAHTRTLPRGASLVENDEERQSLLYPRAPARTPTPPFSSRSSFSPLSSSAPTGTAAGHVPSSYVAHAQPFAGAVPIIDASGHIVAYAATGPLPAPRRHSHVA